ncbi:MAG: translational GTPase TypA [Schleiferiaceae bacterium]|nr:translational GTPase TypA [Schleiferiaceae bacterium]
MNLRNIAIIAHVDHGKTTLVDKILQQVKLFSDHQEVADLLLDSNDLEKERGITILSKNVAVRYGDTKINIIDTPGHADFGGEVERVLNMADGVLLLVDAFEGPMPQTRFVLQKALDLGLHVIVVINKVDKPNCAPEEINEKVFDLMFTLEASDEQLDYPVVYGSSKEGWMGPDWQNPTNDMSHLLDVILQEVPAPVAHEGSLQMRITSLDYSSFTGRIAIGRIHRGALKSGMPVAVVKRDGSIKRSRIKEAFRFEGLGKEKTDELIPAGELVALTGIEGFDIGDTLADAENPEGLTPVAVDEPAMSMRFTINNSPFFGKDGKYVTSRHLRDRLYKETEKNLALRVDETDSPEAFTVYGRGILHLSILVETMRREGYELQLGQPQVVTKEVDGKLHEPVEELHVSVPENFSGKVIELVTERRGDIENIETRHERSYLTFRLAARALMGLTNLILTATEGEAVVSSRFQGFEPWKGDIFTKRNGALIAMETGSAIAYSLNKLQDRGRFFIAPNEEVYEGQVIGENNRADDMALNVTKTKKLSNMRSAGADEKMVLAPPVKMSLEQAMEYVGKDEYVEVTPQHIRLRKILLDENDRKREKKSS